MCYKKIQGLNLKVDVPYFLPKLREEILGTNGWINPRGWKVRKPPQVMGEIHSFILLHSSFNGGRQPVFWEMCM